MTTFKGICFMPVIDNLSKTCQRTSKGTHLQGDLLLFWNDIFKWKKYVKPFLPVIWNRSVRHKTGSHARVNVILDNVVLDNDQKIENPRFCLDKFFMGVLKDHMRTSTSLEIVSMYSLWIYSTVCLKLYSRSWSFP